MKNQRGYPPFSIAPGAPEVDEVFEVSESSVKSYEVS